jgi:cobalamin synthase
MGAVAVTVVLGAVRALRPPAEGPAALLPVLVGVAVATTALAFALRSRLPSRAPGSSADDWWAANLRSAILIWALLESAAMIGAVFYLIGVGTWGLVVAAAALALLVANGPARLADR